MTSSAESKKSATSEFNLGIPPGCVGVGAVSQGFPWPTQHPRLVAGNNEVKLLVTLAGGFVKESAAFPTVSGHSKPATLWNRKQLLRTTQMRDQWGMSNVLTVSAQATIYSLHDRGWSRRRIARELGIDRETVGRYLLLAKPAISTAGGSGASKAANRKKERTAVRRKLRVRALLPRVASK